MPIRTLDTRLSRLWDQRRRTATRPGRPLPATPATPPDEGDGRSVAFAVPMGTWRLGADPLLVVAGGLAVHR